MNKGFPDGGETICPTRTATLKSGWTSSTGLIPMRVCAQKQLSLRSTDDSAGRKASDQTVSPRLVCYGFVTTTHLDRCGRCEVTHRLSCRSMCTVCS